MIDLDSPEEFYQRRMRSVDRRRLLQPRSAGQIISLATRLYQKLAWPILRLTLPSMCLLFAGLIFFQGFVLPGLFTTSNPDDVTVQFTELIVVYAVGLFIALPVVVIALGHSSGLATKLISTFMTDQKIDLDAADKAGRRGAWTMVKLLMQIFLRAGALLMFSGALLMISSYYATASAPSVIGDVATALAVFGLIATFVLAPVVMSTLCLAPAITVIEGETASEAMRRSKLLMKKSRHIPSGYDVILTSSFLGLMVGALLWLGFALSFSTVGLTGLVAELAGRSILWSLFSEALGTLPLFAAIWTLTPFMTCCITVLYYDRRVRLEAYDIEVMAQDVIKGSETADLRL